jgi:hypothetical protein
MILTAKTEGAYHAAARLPCALPLAGMQIDVDPDFCHGLDPEDYVETSQHKDAA